MTKEVEEERGKRRSKADECEQHCTEETEKPRNRVEHRQSAEEHVDIADTRNRRVEEGKETEK